MLVLFWTVWCAASCIALAASDVIKPSGKISISPSVVNLDSNDTIYTVSCQLDRVLEGLDSRSLYIELRNERIKSEILNESTIVAVQQVVGEKLPDCGVRRYICYSAGSGLDVASVSVGWIPAEIGPDQIKCISEDLRDLRCEVPIVRPCDLQTGYKMMMNYRFGSSLCSVDVVGSSLIYDSGAEDQLCVYRNGVGVLRFDLEVSNAIGSRVMSFELSNYDIVRPAPVSRLRVVNVPRRHVGVQWSEEVSLNHLNRYFEYHFLLISEHGRNTSIFEKTSTMIYRYAMDDLHPYTKYTLMVRLRVVPNLPRLFEDEYWSKWSSIVFTTLASKPDQPPRIVPGAFSLKDWNDKLAAIDIYWENIPEYLHNGPGFRYNVSALSDAGQIIYPVLSSPTSPVATFENISHARYRVMISCYNDEGSVESHTELQVFPSTPNHQPKIKRVLNSDHFEVSWYAPTNQQDLISYTVMYCNFTSSNVCQDSIHFAMLPPNATKFKVSSNYVLNFAVSANFANFSTPLSWQECVVSPADAAIGHPKFDIIDLREDSFVVLFNNDCIERSFYDLMRLLVWKGSVLVMEADFEPYRDRFAVRGLSPGTKYAVQVLAYDGHRMVQHTRTVVTKAVNDNLLKAIFYISCGILIALTIFTTATRKIRKVFDIRVETPHQLTAIINMTTIEAKLDLSNFNHSDACLTESIQCSYNDTIMDSKDIPVGRLPAPIEFQQNFKCFLFDLTEKYCEFTPLSDCDKAAEYRLVVQGKRLDAGCELQKVNGTFYFESTTLSCYFPNSDNVTLRLDAVNSIGTRTMHYTVSHDFVKLKHVNGPTLAGITSDNVTIQINEINLKRVKRSVEYQFMVVSKYDTRKSSTESDSSKFDYTIKELYPSTEYKLGMRLRVIPRSPRMFEEEYWSDWSWASFKTIARKPDRAPRTIPGAFSFKDQKEDRASLVVYWEPMAESQWNGPGFRYNVSAVSDTGQWYYPIIDPRDKSAPYEMATFQDIKLGHCRILVSCSNNEGTVQNPNIMEVFPPKNDLKPKIKKVTNNRQSFNVSWYPPTFQNGISNYTVMYCNKTSSAACKDSIRFVTVPATNTSLSLTSPTVLTFAVSANYPNHSSDFSWQQCTVSSGADIGSPQFDLCNVTDTSFDIRMTTVCSSSSLYELLEVIVLKNNSAVWHERFKRPTERISIQDLSPDTEYVVQVLAYDENRTLHETSNTVQTSSRFTKLQLTLYFLCGMLLVSALTVGTTRKVRSLSNIHVEMPVALQTLFGIDGEESKMMLRAELTEHVERTPRIYVELPSKGYNNFPMVIPEEDDEIEDGSLLKVEANTCLVDDSCKVDTKVDLQDQSVQTGQANGYVLASQFIKPKGNQLPENVTNGTTSGYVVFK